MWISSRRVAKSWYVTYFPSISLIWLENRSDNEADTSVGDGEWYFQLRCTNNSLNQWETKMIVSDCQWPGIGDLWLDRRVIYNTYTKFEFNLWFVTLHHGVCYVKNIDAYFPLLLLRNYDIDIVLHNWKVKECYKAGRKYVRYHLTTRIKSITLPFKIAKKFGWQEESGQEEKWMPLKYKAIHICITVSKYTSLSSFFIQFVYH